jgi:hypothetical protein
MPEYHRGTADIFPGWKKIISLQWGQTFRVSVFSQGYQKPYVFMLLSGIINYTG